MRMSATTPLRAGVIGLGWAGQQHMQGYLEAANAELVAICGQEGDVAARLAGQFGVEQTYREVSDLLRDAQLDVVSIATPTSLHAPMAIAALDAGVHVLSEKPIAENATTAAMMVAAARRNDRVLEVSYNHRRRGVVTALKQAIDDGMLGKIYYAKAGWVRRQGIPGLGTWFTRKDSAGGGPFMDIGVHMVDMALHLLGEPGVSAVSANTYAEFGPRGLGGSTGYRGTSAGTTDYEVEDLATAFCRLDDGGTLVVEASWAQWVPHDLCFVDLYGSEAGAHLQWGSPTSGDGGELVIMTDVQGRPAEIRPQIPANGGHSACVAEFCDLVLSGDRQGVDGSLSLTRAGLIDAAYASAAQQREVLTTQPEIG